MIRQIAPLFFAMDIPATLAYYRDKLGFECLGVAGPAGLCHRGARPPGDSLPLRRATANPDKYRAELLDAYVFVEPLTLYSSLAPASMCRVAPTHQPRGWRDGDKKLKAPCSATVALALIGWSLSVHAQSGLGLINQQWHEDLALLARELPKRHVNAFHFISRARFEAEVADLDAKLDHLNTNEIYIGMNSIATSIGDAHTYIQEPR